MHLCVRQGGREAGRQGGRESIIMYVYYVCVQYGPELDAPNLHMSNIFFRSGSMVWRSGPITHRLSASALLTKSGSVYHLVGGLDRSGMRIPGTGSVPVPDAIVAHFKYGFPRKWIQLLQQVVSKQVQEPRCVKGVVNQHVNHGQPTT